MWPCVMYLKDNMAETQSLASKLGAGRLTSHRCDVSSEQDVLRFRDEVAQQHETQHINLLFNNAGIAGGGSVIDIDRREWERTFGVCWYGVFYGCTAFMPMLVASEEAHIVNTSSVNGFWASVGPMTAHTSYSAAKFAVKGFTEAMIIRPAHERPARALFGGDARSYWHFHRFEYFVGFGLQRVGVRRARGSGCSRTLFGAGFAGGQCAR